MTEWKEDIFFEVKFVRQKLFKYHIKLLLQQVCLSFQHMSLILSGSCNHLECGKWEWILILRMRNLILPNTRRRYWSMWRKNTAPNIGTCQSLNLKTYLSTFFSLLQWLQDLVNLLMIHMISPVMMKNAECQKCGRNEARMKWLRITVSYRRQALFESTAWVTPELGARESES